LPPVGGAVVVPPSMITAEPEGFSAIRARHGPRGAAAWFTATVTVVDCPAARVPDVRLRRSHRASVAAVQSTGPRADAVSVIVVSAPEVRAVTASRPALSRSPPVLTTSAVTSGECTPRRSPGRALPAFS
jgi:hypothetical protein